MHEIKKFRRYGLVFVLIATFLVYDHALTYSFVWDDHAFIIEWQTPKLGIHGILPLLLGDAPVGHEGIYRPIRGIYYIISHYFFQQNPVFYHLQGIMVHLVATVAVYIIIKCLFKRYTLALVGSLIFGIHPVHVESVTWITSSFDTIGQVLALWTFACYLLWRQSRQKHQYYLSVMLAGISIFSHESASVLPLLILGYEVLIARRSCKLSNIKRLAFIAPYLGLVLLYWLIRIPVLGIVSRQPYPFESPLHTFWFMGSIFMKYLQNLILPIHLTVNHPLAAGIQSLYWADLNYQNPPAVPSFANPVLIVSWLLIALFLVGLYRLRRSYQFVSFSLFWILLCLMPVMQVFPISSLYNERYAYPASVGFSILMVWAVSVGMRLKPGGLKQKLSLIFFTLVIWYAVKTPLQNQIWKNNFSLWHQAVAKNPLSNSNLTNLANAYVAVDNLDKAVELYEKAIALNPSQAINYTNIGIIQYKLGDKNAAMKSFTTALALKPPSQIANLYVGILYHQQHRLEEAKKAYETYRSLYPRFPDTYLYLGMLAHQENNYDSAKQLYYQAISLKPTYADAYNNLGNVYRDQGDLAEAINAYDIALTLSPNHEYAARNLNEALQLTSAVASQSADRAL